MTGWVKTQPVIKKFIFEARSVINQSHKVVTYY